MTTQLISVPLEILERWLEETKDFPPVQRLAKIVNQAAAWGVGQVKGMEQEALVSAIQQISLEALDEGVRAASGMVRLAGEMFPGMTPRLIADKLDDRLLSYLSQSFLILF